MYGVFLAIIDHQNFYFFWVAAVVIKILHLTTDSDSPFRVADVIIRPLLEGAGGISHAGLSIRRVVRKVVSVIFTVLHPIERAGRIVIERRNDVYNRIRGFRYRIGE